MIDGDTDVPEFSIDTGAQPLDLKTRFHAVVDGTTGDTYLQPVPAGQIKDFLELAVKTRPVIMTGTIMTRTKLQIRPGPERVAKKLSFQGQFALSQIHFMNPKVQDKVDMLSLRTSGKPELAKPGASDVLSRMNGDFELLSGDIKLRRLRYQLPGARVNLSGVYSLDGQRFEFRGKVETNASLSQMVSSRWASFALKAVPRFRRRGGGAEIPVKITGTKSEPKFGLDLFRKD